VERFDKLLLLFPEKIRPYIMNIAERHSMYGTKVEAQIISRDYVSTGELIEISPEEEEDEFSWTFLERGYSIEVPGQFLEDAGIGWRLILRGEKHGS